jgi:hypothetical protein
MCWSSSNISLADKFLRYRCKVIHLKQINSSLHIFPPRGVERSSGNTPRHALSETGKEECDGVNGEEGVDVEDIARSEEDDMLGEEVYKEASRNG